MQEHDLKHGHDEQGREVQRVKPREPQQREFCQADPSGSDRIAIKPKENEAGERKKEIHRRPALIVEQAECPIERLRILSPAMLVRAGDGVKVLPVPKHHRQSRDSPQSIERMKALHISSWRWSQSGLIEHILSLESVESATAQR